ncbi:hypothetical protein Tco_0718057 [Tanacetum coccineum]
MTQLKYCDKHNQVGFLHKPDESAGFAEIVDFLRGSNLRYALTTNPTIYDSLLRQFWQTATANTNAEGTLEIKATINTIRYTNSEVSIRDSLQLEDATGITMLPNDALFEGMGQIGYPTDGTFTFWKSFFTPQWRYLVHHLLHCISPKSGGWDQLVAILRLLDLSIHWGFQGAPRPLLPSMLLVATNPIAGQEHAAQAQTQPIPPPPPIPTPTPPSIPSPTPPPIPPSTSPPPIIPSPTLPPIPTPTPPPPPETEPPTYEHIY